MGGTKKQQKTKQTGDAHALTSASSMRQDVEPMDVELSCLGHPAIPARTSSASSHASIATTHVPSSPSRKLSGVSDNLPVGLADTIMLDTEEKASISVDVPLNELIRENYLDYSFYARYKAVLEQLVSLSETSYLRKVKVKEHALNQDQCILRQLLLCDLANWHEEDKLRSVKPGTSDKDDDNTPTDVFSFFDRQSNSLDEDSPVEVSGRGHRNGFLPEMGIFSRCNGVPIPQPEPYNSHYVRCDFFGRAPGRDFKNKLDSPTKEKVVPTQIDRSASKSKRSSQVGGYSPHQEEKTEAERLREPIKKLESELEFYQRSLKELHTQLRYFNKMNLKNFLVKEKPDVMIPLKTFIAANNKKKKIREQIKAEIGSVEQKIEAIKKEIESEQDAIIHGGADAPLFQFDI